ncbi:hypothetical protein A2Z23_00050 [Candidatus Curtissbacteria bacterium RBG_16_39_7]|uniref:Nucleoid-associated protein, YbaB/EbfC family n=1 Tax=Candidatus Curtissbacteria bacterium RBG_16_39_7 TaxID=1797707 RepID=A0A1F5G3Q2_9BACT|nr:MAG: hypothetical protein A2Z23_00050 [Candidatus Curtissbacteria bacterium RBG_16_39_7]
MFDKFRQMAELKKMRDQALGIQKQLDAEIVEVEKNGVTVKISLAQKVREIVTNGKSDSDIAEAVNQAIKESQEKAAKKMQGMVGIEGLKGLLGQ